MVHEGTRARPPRQRLTLELTVLLTTFMVVIGVWTRTVVLAEPSPTAAVPAAVHLAPIAGPHREGAKLTTRHPDHRSSAPRRASLSASPR
jgi:hypothetical protein